MIAIRKIIVQSKITMYAKNELLQENAILTFTPGRNDAGHDGFCLQPQGSPPDLQ